MHFLSADDFSESEINKIFAIADQISAGKTFSLGQGTTLALLFEKASTRTRVSFETAMAHMNGHSIYIDANTSQLSRGEAVSDTARVLSSYVDFIAARLCKQSDLLELARYSSVPVINALTDLEHPCQALGDLYTIKEAKKRIKGLRIAFVGDIAANTANSLMITAAKLGADVILVGPKGYKPNGKFVGMARKHGKVETRSSLGEGLRDVDVIYTDAYVSMGQEAEAAKRRKLFKGYQVNKRLLKHARSDAIVMHCLPAHRGEEITSDVLDGKSSAVWLQAKNKMLIEEAILLFLSKSRVR